ncbi:MAG: universal stress protein [Caldilineaceae bacterium]
MFRKILIPLDGSPLAEQTLAFLPRFTQPLQTELLLVSIVQPWTYTMGATDAMPVSALDSLIDSWNTYLHEQALRLTGAGFNVRTQIREGDTALEILSLAGSEGVDLIAMSTHGRAGLSRIALGSIAERVLQGATLPLLLVRNQNVGQASSKIQQILTPLDGSDFAEQAVPLATEMAKQCGAELTLLRVIQELDEHNKRLLFKSQQEADESLQRVKGLTSRYLEQVAYRLYSDGFKVHCEILSGEPSNTICTTAETLPADLIVMSTHGRSGVARWMYGSVANKVLRNAPCPVLLVRSKHDAK